MLRICTDNNKFTFVDREKTRLVFFVYEMEFDLFIFLYKSHSLNMRLFIRIVVSQLKVRAVLSQSESEMKRTKYIFIINEVNAAYELRKLIS